ISSELALLLGPVDALLDPRREIGHHLGAQGLVWLHFEVVMGVLDRLNEQTFGRIAGDDSRTALAPLEQCLPRIDAQTVTCLLAAVTLEAGTGKNRPDIDFKES